MFGLEELLGRMCNCNFIKIQLFIQIITFKKKTIVTVLLSLMMILQVITILINTEKMIILTITTTLKTMKTIK